MRDPSTRAANLESEGRHREAFRVLLRAAQGGDSDAFLNLGYFYGNGLGIRRSRSKELYWYRRAVRAGCVSAVHNIGIVYRDRGQLSRAMRWLRKAIAMGESDSNLELGMLLLARFGRCEEALGCFRSVDASENAESTIESALLWAAVTESMLAGRDAA